MGTQFQFYEIEKNSIAGWWWYYTTMGMYLMPITVQLELVKMVTFMYILPQLKKKRERELWQSQD